MSSELTVEIVGTPAELRAAAEEVMQSLADAGPLLRRFKAVPPRQRRRLGKVKVIHARALLPRAVVVHVPERRESTSRPRERRPSTRRRTASRDGPGSSDDADLDPEPVRTRARTTA